MIPTGQFSYNTPSFDQVETYYIRIGTFKNYFFLYIIVEWNKLNLDIWKSKSYIFFPKPWKQLVNQPMLFIEFIITWIKTPY